ncbi:hypothetical protein GCM10009850_009300 [Nonomuraea monospora]|uniref:Uncharacterized protein n=1 Tax=Nonomuraea monospora TaxID=568818 RepID=A0ABN3C807_9ACTN
METVRLPIETFAGLARSTAPRCGRPVTAPAATGAALLSAANMPVTNNLRDKPRYEPFTADPPIHLAR